VLGIRKHGLRDAISTRGTCGWSDGTLERPVRASPLHDEHLSFLREEAGAIRDDESEVTGVRAVNRRIIDLIDNPV